MSKIRIDHHGSIAVIQLDVPPVNIVDVALLEDREAALRELAASPGVVVTGAGRAFSAGVDLKQLLEGGEAYASRLLEAMSSSFAALFEFPGPVVAAVNGHAIAGGCALALAADLRLASGGLIGLSELSIGLPFPPVPFEIVRGALGHHASRVVVDAQLHQVAEAKELRLVGEIVPAEDLLDSALAPAERLAAIPASTYARTKSALRPRAGGVRAGEPPRGPEPAGRRVGLPGDDPTRREGPGGADCPPRSAPPVVVRALLRAPMTSQCGGSRGPGNLFP